MSDKFKNTIIFTTTYIWIVYIFPWDSKQLSEKNRQRPVRGGLGGGLNIKNFVSLEDD